MKRIFFMFLALLLCGMVQAQAKLYLQMFLAKADKLKDEKKTENFTANLQI